MAFTSFGTGLASVAQGMSYQPDWNAETQRILALTQQMQNFYTTKMQIADKVYETMKPVILENKADSDEYNKYFEDVSKEMYDYASTNPDYMTNYRKHSIWKTMGEKIRNNAITQRAEQFKKEKEVGLKFIQEHSDLPESQREDILNRMNVRATEGVEAYQRKFGESDFIFQPPKIENFTEIVKNMLAANRKSTWKTKLDESSGRVIISDVETNGDFDEMAKKIMTVYPTASENFIKEHTQLLPENERLSKIEYVKKLMAILASPENEKYLGNIDPNDKAAEWARINIAQQGQDSQDEYYDFQINKANEVPSYFDYFIIQNGGTLNDRNVTSLIPGYGPKSFKGSTKGDPAYTTNTFAGDQLSINGFAITGSKLTEAGFSLTYNMNQISSLKYGTADSGIIFAGRLVGKFKSEDAAEDAITLLPSQFQFLKKGFIKKVDNEYVVSWNATNCSTLISNTNARSGYEIQYRSTSKRAIKPNGGQSNSHAESVFEKDVPPELVNGVENSLTRRDDLDGNVYTYTKQNINGTVIYKRVKVTQ